MTDRELLELMTRAVDEWAAQMYWHTGALAYGRSAAEIGREK